MQVSVKNVYAYKKVYVTRAENFRIVDIRIKA